MIKQMEEVDLVEGVDLVVVVLVEDVDLVVEDGDVEDGDVYHII